MLIQNMVNKNSGVLFEKVMTNISYTLKPIQEV